MKAALIDTSDDDEKIKEDKYGVAEEVVYNYSLDKARQQAKKIVKNYVALSAGGGWVPHAYVAMTPMLAKMCRDIAKCFQVTDYAAETVIGTVSASVASHAVADTVLTYIPVFGWAAKAAVAGSVTFSLGEALIEYFEKRSPLSIKDTQEGFDAG